MNLKEALKRIEDLERKVRELESRPPQHLHYHYPQQPFYYPAYPYYQPYPIIPQGPTWTSGGTGLGGSETFQITFNGGASCGPEH